MPIRTEIEYGNVVFINDLREFDNTLPVLRGTVLTMRTFITGKDKYLALKLDTGYEVVIKGIKELEVRE